MREVLLSTGSNTSRIKVFPSAKLLQLGEQIIQPVDEIYRVIQLLTCTEDRLIEENVGPVREALLILLIA